MRIAIVLTLLIVLTSLSACNGTSIGNPEIMPKWPPDRPVLVQAPEVDQETIDMYRYLIFFFEDVWSNFNPDKKYDAWGALSAIYFQAVEEKNNMAINASIYAMGRLGFVEFLPLMIDALENPDIEDKNSIISAVDTMPSAYSIFILTNYINHDDIFIREKVINGLRTFKYYGLFPGTRTQAIKALLVQREVEQSEWLLKEIDQALEVLSGDG